MAKKKIGIIGAGMSGLVAAIMLAKEGHKVTLFEANEKIGKKLLVTGNGRCNISHVGLKEDNFHSMTKNIFTSVYTQFDYNKTKDFFLAIGIDFVVNEEDKVYPKSLQAASVVKALLMECDHYQVDIVYGCRVRRVEHTNKFKIVTDDKSYYINYLIMATGGKSYSDSGSRGDGYELSKAFGHSVTQTYPSIVQLKTDGTYNKALKGLKVQTKGQLLDEKDKLIREDSGEVLFTDYGLSGPVILQLSTKVEPALSNGKALYVSLDLMEDMDEQELDSYLMNRLHNLSYRNIEDALIGFVNQRLIAPLLNSAGIKQGKKAGDVSKAERQMLVQTLKGYKSKVVGTYLWNQAQVTKGGIDCREVDEETLESTKCKGLYLVGEVLDMDGDCGGYNLQWAISSGAVCAKAIINC